MYSIVLQFTMIDDGDDEKRMNNSNNDDDDDDNDTGMMMNLTLDNKIVHNENQNLFFLFCLVLKDL